MRRSGYKSLSTNPDQSNYEEIDGTSEDIERAKIIEGNDGIDNKPPYKALFLVFFLFFMGIFTIIVSLLIFFGHLDEKTYADRMIPLTILGILMFIPGAYYSRIVYYVARGDPNYNYEMIPSCS